MAIRVEETTLWINERFGMKRTKRSSIFSCPVIHWLLFWNRSRKDPLDAKDNLCNT